MPMDKKVTPLAIATMVTAVLVVVLTCLDLFANWSIPGLTPGLCAVMTTLMYIHYHPTDKAKFGISLIFLVAAVLNVIAAIMQIIAALR